MTFASPVSAIAPLKRSDPSSSVLASAAAPRAGRKCPGRDSNPQAPEGAAGFKPALYSQFQHPGEAILDGAREGAQRTGEMDPGAG